MPNLAKYTVELEAQVARYEKNLDRANKKLDRFNRQQGRNLDAIKSQFIKLGVAIGGALSVSKITREFVRVERSTGVLNAQLETATGSIQGARDAFEQLEKFAAKTPFSLDESVTAFTRLVNLGLTPSERALMSYGNTAAATGKTILQFTEAVADASVGEFERLKEFGIKASKEGEKITFRFRGLSTEVGNSIGEIEEFLTRLGETAFAGGLERRIDTLDGKLSNLGDSWDSLFRTINESGVGDAIKKSIDIAIKAVDDLKFVIDTFFNDEITSLQSELGKLNKQLDNIRKGGVVGSVTGLLVDENEVLARRAEILARLDELRARDKGRQALKTFSQQADVAGGAQAGEFAGPPLESAQQRFTRLSQQYDDLMAKQRLANEMAGEPFMTTAESAQVLFDKFDELAEKQEVAGQRFNELFANNMVQAAESGFDSVLDSWLKTLQQMAAQLISSQVFKMLSNIGGGGAGSFGGFITNLFGGSFATGGTVPGPLGAPRLIMAHAGEEVIPIGGSAGTSVHIGSIDARGASADVVPMIEEGVARAVKLAAQDRVQAKRRGK